MSAIAGIWNMDGRLVEPETLDSMLDTMRHRGPDSKGLWHGGPVGLGSRMLWTTQESLNERLPLRDKDSGFVITADARIDNRDELIRRLRMKKQPVWITDSELILEAYKKWGTGCARKLLGDFSFVIWDGHQERLFCARDNFGVRPFFYYYGGEKSFVFGSEIKALFTLSEVPRRQCEGSIAEYLGDFMEGRTESSTFYKDVLRLPPAHKMVVTREGVCVERYWTLRPERELRLGSDREYAEGFKERFDEAVACRLRSVYPVGSELSGGLDSSSVTCVARRLVDDNKGSSSNIAGGRLHTFSSVYDDTRGANEGRFVDSVLSENDVRSHIITGAGRISTDDIEQILRHQDEPMIPPTLLIQWPLYRLAKEKGVRVMLDGFDGDSTVMHGAPYLIELLLSGRFLRVAREVGLFAKNSGRTRLEVIKSAMLRELLPDNVINAWKTFRKRPDRSAKVISKDLAGKFSIFKRQSAFNKKSFKSHGNTRYEHAKLLAPGMQSLTCEVRDRAAMAFSLELRHPFFDRRLVEYCLSLPPEQSFKNGWTRMVLRRAMKGVLPEDIRWRADKGTMSPELLENLMAMEEPRLGFLLRDGGFMNDYIDKQALQKFYDLVTSDGDGYAMVVLWGTLVMARWMDAEGAAGKVEPERRLSAVPGAGRLQTIVKSREHTNV